MSLDLDQTRMILTNNNQNNQNKTKNNQNKNDRDNPKAYLEWIQAEIKRIEKALEKLEYSNGGMTNEYAFCIPVK